MRSFLGTPLLSQIFLDAEQSRVMQCGTYLLASGCSFIKLHKNSMTSWGTWSFQVSRPARFLGCPAFGKMTRSLEALRSPAFGQSVGEDWPGNRGLWLTKKSDVWAQADVVLLFSFCKYLFSEECWLSCKLKSQSRGHKIMSRMRTIWLTAKCTPGLWDWLCKSRKSHEQHTRNWQWGKKNTEEIDCVKDDVQVTNTEVLLWLAKQTQI